MPAPILVRLADVDSSFPGWLYLPGEPVPGLDGYTSFLPSGCPGSGTECDYCSNPLGWRGTSDLATGAQVPQAPGQGDHDGVVSSVYAPMPGVARMESGWAHLRCVLDATGTGVVESITLGDFDPTTVDTGDDTPGAHAIDGPRAAQWRAVPGHRTVTGVPVLVTRG